ncbi:MAG: hypothetical protein AB8B57_04660 [Congregibacter sp.]
MSKLEAVTPPVWILVLTLVAIVVTGALFGKSSPELRASDCASLAVEARADNAVLQQPNAGRCTAQSGKSGKSIAPALFAILVLSAGLYSVWWRQKGRVRQATSPVPSASDESANSASGKTASSVAPQKVVAVSPKPKRQSKKTKSGSYAESDASNASADDGLTVAQRHLCLEALQDKEERLKDEVIASLGQFVKSSDTALWKSAPLDDLELLTSSLAVAALAGPEVSRYRRAFQASSSTAANAAVEDLREQTKKALQALCIATLRRDLQLIAARPAHPESLSVETVRTVVDALHAKDALAGLSRCSKAALVHLAEFLQG